MKRNTIGWVACLAVLQLIAYPADAWADCGDNGVALQILGSGGPFGAGRASAGYLVWVDGKSRIMVDAGGGTFVRFHEAGARVGDLSILALSHFHPDHSAEVPALFWGQLPNLLVAGPSGNSAFPSVGQFLNALFASPDGAFRVVGGMFEATTVTVDVDTAVPTEIFSDERIAVRGIGVPHANVPTVGFRVDIGDASIAFASDQVATSAAFDEMISGVDLLVVHFAASERPGAMAALHAKPSAWGKLAARAGAKTVVLSHLMEPDSLHPVYAMTSGADLAGNIAAFRSAYAGPLVVAEDLLCVAVE